MGALLTKDLVEAYNSSSSENTNDIPAKPKPIIKNINMGKGKWNYYLHNKDGSYKEGEFTSALADSIVRGKGNAPDTNFKRTYSQPDSSKKTIPRKPI